VGLAIVAPVAFLVLWLFREVERLTQPRVEPGPNSTEQDQLAMLENLIIEYQDSRESILRIGDESGIPRRGDNLFDGRYGAGRDVNNQLEPLISDIAKLKWAKSEIEDKISARIASWRMMRARSTGARVGVAVYVTLFAVIAQMAPPWASAIEKLSDIVGFTLNDMTATLLGSSAVASLGAGGALWLVSSTSNKTA
jgi:hypothetical protein